MARCIQPNRGTRASRSLGAGGWLRVCCLALMFTSCSEGPRVLLGDPSSPTVLDLRVADDEVSRARGLLAWDAQDREVPLLLVWPRPLPDLSVWTVGLIAPIDVVFIADPPAVVGIVDRAPADSTEPIASDLPARYVLELRAGEAQALGLTPETWISIEL